MLGRGDIEGRRIWLRMGMRVTGIPRGLLIKDGDQIVGAVGVSGLLPREDLEIAEHILSRG